MTRAIQVLTSMGHPEGDWRVDKMMEATGEAEEEAERLETERRSSEQELGNSAISNPDSQAKLCAERRRTARRGQAVATAGKLPKLKDPHASLGIQHASL